MYLHFFHLHEEPFNVTPDPRFLFLSHQHEVAIASLVYGTTHRKGFMLLAGEIGTGKTTICRELINRLGPDMEIAVILNPLLSVPGLLRAINRDFGNEVIGETAEEQLDGLNRFLLRRVKEGGNAVVLIDEAQNLSIEALEMTRLLSNLETDQQKLVQIILVGQPELERTLESPRLCQLAQRIVVRHHLGRLTLEETQAYILHRLTVAGGHGQLDFDGHAVRRLHHHAAGYPRRINILCDRALLAAYARRTRTISKRVMMEAVRDVDGRKRSWWQFWRS